MSQPEAGKRAFALKPLSKDGVEAALSKAEHYRLLNQPKLAESICLDILEIDRGNQKALVVLLLALTDQFGSSSPSVVKQAEDIIGKLNNDYARLYYSGIIRERQGNVSLRSSAFGADYDAYEWYLEAMELYEKAEAIQPPSNNDAVLRWNTCARTIMQFKLEERPSDAGHPILE